MSADMDESETTRPRPFWRRFALFVLAGTLYTGLALLGVFLVDFLVRFPMALAGTEWPRHEELHAHWMLLTGVGIGIGFTAASPQLRRRGRDWVAVSRAKPIRAFALIFLACVGVTYCDFTRAETTLSTFPAGDWAAYEVDTARRRVAPQNMSETDARAAMESATNGIKLERGGWTFRVATNNDPLPPGAWYPLEYVISWLPWKDRPEAEGPEAYDGDFNISVVVKPRSLGARLYALLMETRGQQPFAPTTYE